MKGFKQCKQGHFFNDDLSDCPYCPKGNATKSTDAPTEFIGGGGGAVETSTYRKVPPPRVVLLSLSGAVVVIIGIICATIVILLGGWRPETRRSRTCSVVGGSGCVRLCLHIATSFPSVHVCVIAVSTAALCSFIAFRTSPFPRCNTSENAVLSDGTFRCMLLSQSNSLAAAFVAKDRVFG